MDIFEPRKITYYLDSAGLIQGPPTGGGNLTRPSSSISTSSISAPSQGLSAVGTSAFSEGRSVALLAEHAALHQSAAGFRRHRKPTRRNRGQARASASFFSARWN